MTISFLQHALNISLLLFLASCASQKTRNQEKLSRIYFKQGTQELVEQKYTEALSNLLKAENHDPNNPEIQNNLGMAYMFKNQEQKAMEHLKKAISLKPNHADAKMNIATIYLNKGQLIKAEKIYQNLLKTELTYKGLFRVYYNLGIIEELKKNPQKALLYFKKAIQEEPRYCPAQIKLGNNYAKSNDHQQALIHFKEAASGSCQKDAFAHYQQAITHLKLKQYDSAKFKFQEIISRFPQSHHSKLATEKLESFQALINQQERAN